MSGGVLGRGYFFFGTHPMSVFQAVTYTKKRNGRDAVLSTIF
jgi:hypothetical protein